MRKWQTTPEFLLGTHCGQRSLAGYNPCDHKESDMTEPLSTHSAFVYYKYFMILRLLAMTRMILLCSSQTKYSPPPLSDTKIVSCKELLYILVVKKVYLKAFMIHREL